MDTSLAVAATIRAEAAALGFNSPDRFAATVGIPKTTFRRYWDGDREPRVDELVLIVAGLHLKLSDFFLLVEQRVNRATTEAPLAVAQKKPTPRMDAFKRDRDVIEPSPDRVTTGQSDNNHPNAASKAK